LELQGSLKDLAQGEEALVVSEASARGEDFNIVEGADHFTVCRPRSKTVRSFYKLRDFVSAIAGKANS
jgi:hypothetical protein